MSYLCRSLESRLDPDDWNRIVKTLNAYGVDFSRDSSTMLGYGSFKEAHRTNVEGLVIFLTKDYPQLEEEMIILELLRDSGYPAMEYHCLETIGELTIVLAQRLYPVDMSWDEDRQLAIKEQVKEWLGCMLEERIFPTDLQFMVDKNDQVVFTDPLHLYLGDSSYHYHSWDDMYVLEATCKDRRASLHASATRRK